MADDQTPKWLNEARVSKDASKQKLFLDKIVVSLLHNPKTSLLLSKEALELLKSSNAKTVSSTITVLELLIDQSEVFRTSIFSDARILKEFATVKHRKLLGPVFANWMKNFSRKFPLIEGAVAQLRRKGVQIPDLESQEISDRQSQRDTLAVEWSKIDTEISQHFHDIHALLVKTQSLIDIVFPATLAEAFAGLPEISTHESSSHHVHISDSTNFRHSSILDPCVRSELQEAVDLLKRKKLRIVRSWLDRLDSLLALNPESPDSGLNAAIEAARRKWRGFLQDWETLESRVLLLLAQEASAQSSQAPSQIDSEYEDDF